MAGAIVVDEAGEHLRHRPPAALEHNRPCIVACPQFKSNVNLSRIVRLAGCCGVTRMLVAGNGKIDPKIARDAADLVQVERRRSLAPRLADLKSQGFLLVGLEQTTRSMSIYDFAFPHKIVLTVGNERSGLQPDVLALMDELIEIPVYGLPYSYNVVTALSMALYEYCKQYPQG